MPAGHAGRFRGSRDSIFALFGIWKGEQLAGPRPVWSTLLTDGDRQTGRSAISGFGHGSSSRQADWPFKAASNPSFRPDAVACVPSAGDS